MLELGHFVFAIVVFIQLITNSETTGEFQLLISTKLGETTNSTIYCHKVHVGSRMKCPMRVDVCLLEHQPLVEYPARCSFGSASRRLQQREQTTGFGGKISGSNDTIIRLPFNFTWTSRELCPILFYSVHPFIIHLPLTVINCEAKIDDVVVYSLLHFTPQRFYKRNDDDGTWYLQLGTCGKSFTVVITISQQVNQTSWITVERLKMSSRILPGSPWQQCRYPGSRISASFWVRVVCNENYFGLTCTKFCRRRNDTFGHYRCDQDGQKVCDEGWFGATCLKPICKKWCSKQHGSCRVPGECSCAFGWTGPLCTECMPHPKCANGVCVDTPWSCVCLRHWGGLLCNQDLNPCRTSPCHNGGLCSNPQPNIYACSCPWGYTGHDCESVLDEHSMTCCKVNGTIHKTGEMWYEGCMKCQCRNASIHCVKISCASQDCFHQSRVNKTSRAICSKNDICVAADRSFCLTPPCHRRGRCTPKGGTRIATVKGAHCDQCATGVMDIDVTKLPVGVTIAMICEALERLDGVSSLLSNCNLSLVCHLNSTTPKQPIVSVLVTLSVKTNGVDNQNLTLIIARKMFNEVARLRNDSIFAAVIHIDVIYADLTPSALYDYMQSIHVMIIVLSFAALAAVIGWVLHHKYRGNTANSSIVAQNLYNKKLLNISRFSNPLFVTRSSLQTSNEDVCSLRTEESSVNLHISANLNRVKNEVYMEKNSEENCCLDMEDNG